MSAALRAVLGRFAAGTWRQEDYAAAFAEVMDGAATAGQTGAFLAMTAQRTTDPDLLTAGAQALRARMTPVIAPSDAVDVCGTGGDGGQTLNISTAVAFILAGCGLTVAKHGNRAMSSRAGAADTLEALGVRLDPPISAIEAALAHAGAAFLFAQAHHPAMRNVGPVRRELGFRTVFNLLGPLSNPAGVRRQLLGVFDPTHVGPIAEALFRLGAEAAWVVHGAGGLDEVSPLGPTEVAAVADGGIRRFSIEPADFGLSPLQDLSQIAGGEAGENAAALQALLDAAPNANPAYRTVCILNAAAALAAVGAEPDLKAAAAQAAHALNSGAARAALDAMAATVRGGDAP